MRASPPVGRERVVLLVTRAPFEGFVQGMGQTITRPMALAIRAQDFIRRVNDATAALPPPQWSLTETLLTIYDPKAPS